ncbi:MAG: DinB family protein [Anaerolineales bacterium]|jgi:uncharacterized damage-inducible protein DinB
MDNAFLFRMFEHNNWANEKMIEFCGNLSKGQLDVNPKSTTRGSIRQTLVHLVRAQHGYLELLTIPSGARRAISPSYSELANLANSSGEGLLDYLRDEAVADEQGRLETSDGYFVAPWVVLVQVIQHAAEHREQLSSMLTDLGLDPPDLDGWSFGESRSAVVPMRRE